MARIDRHSRAALQDGNWLGESWAQVLTCISQLARLQMFAEGMPQDAAFGGGAGPGMGSGMMGAGKAFGKHGNKDKDGNGSGGGGGGGGILGWITSHKSAGDVAKETEQANAEAVMAQVDALAVDRVFSSSLRLEAVRCPPPRARHASLVLSRTSTCSLTRSLAHSLTHSLTHSSSTCCSHSLTHSLAHSLLYTLLPNQPGRHR